MFGLSHVSHQFPTFKSCFLSDYKVELLNTSIGPPVISQVEDLKDDIEMQHWVFDNLPLDNNQKQRVLDTLHRQKNREQTKEDIDQLEEWYRVKKELEEAHVYSQNELEQMYWKAQVQPPDNYVEAKTLEEISFEQHNHPCSSSSSNNLVGSVEQDPQKIVEETPESLEDSHYETYQGTDWAQ